MPSSFELALRLFAQLSLILLACRLVGWVVRPLGQTQVIGEMVAGVLLGPAVFGAVAPGPQEALFPKTLALAVGSATTTVTHPSMILLYGLSQLGIVLFMFVVGLQLDTGLLARQVRRAGAISLGGVLAPLAMGAVLGFLLSGDTMIYPPSVAPWQAGLFMGAAMAITAFPVLARIIHEHGIAEMGVGTLALASAALSDAVAWSLLALVLASSQGSPTLALLAIGGALVYTLGMFYLRRPILRAFACRIAPDGDVHPPTFAALLLMLFACAWFSEAIGIHAVFGAFVLGAVMPRGRFATAAARQIEGLAVPLLLPIFFVYLGLNMQFGLLLEPSALAITAAIILVAFACKGGACLLAARLSGATWRESAALGALMNARGLMELILINIGLEKGLISPALFSMLALMTIATTVAASPLFSLCWGAQARSTQAEARGTA